MSSSVAEQTSDQHRGNVAGFAGFPISFDPSLGPNQCVLLIDGKVVNNLVVTSYQVTHDNTDTYVYVEGWSMPVSQNVDVTFSLDLGSAKQPTDPMTIEEEMLKAAAATQKEILAQQKMAEAAHHLHGEVRGAEVTGYALDETEIKDYYGKNIKVGKFYDTSPWIPTPEEMTTIPDDLVSDYHRQVDELLAAKYNPPGVYVNDVATPLPRFYDPLAYFSGTMGPSTTYRAPSASQDMSKRPRPRYGWRG